MKRPGLVRVLARGLVIDVEPRGRGIVDLVVRAHEKHRSPWRRIAQHVANALYRVADVLHAGNHDDPIRVVQFLVRGQAIKDELADPAEAQVVQRFATNLPNGDRAYNTFVVYEGVEHEEKGFLRVPFDPHSFKCPVALSANERADDPHPISHVIFDLEDQGPLATDYARRTGATTRGGAA